MEEDKKMPETTERLLAVVEDIQHRQQISQSRLERECKVGSVFTNIKKQGFLPHLNTICSIINRYPSYSAEWIVTGRGKMIYNDFDAAAEESLRKEIEALRKENEMLLALNKRLQERLLL